MKLVVLGSGTSVPHPQRASAAYWLESAGGSLLLDISPDGAHNYRLLQQHFAIEIIEVDGGAEFEMLPGLRARTFSTPHTQESLAIRLVEGEGSSFVYTSDTGYADEIADFAKGVDLLLMECSFRR